MKTRTIASSQVTCRFAALLSRRLLSSLGLVQAEARGAASASFITYGAGTQRSCFSHTRRTNKRI
jgi:hypothetical protein